MPENKKAPTKRSVLFADADPAFWSEWRESNSRPLEPHIEALNGWMKEELYLDFDLAHSHDVPALLDAYVDFFNNHRPAAALGYRSPVQFKTERASDKYSFYCLLSLDKCTVLPYSDLFYFVMAQRLPIHFVTMYAVISAMADTTKLIR